MCARLCVVLDVALKQRALVAAHMGTHTHMDTSAAARVSRFQNGERDAHTSAFVRVCVREQAHRAAASGSEATSCATSASSQMAPHLKAMQVTRRDWPSPICVVIY